jgi:hypothetical protein
VIEAESQAVLNTLTEHDFQDALMVMTASRFEIIGQIAAPVPEILDSIVRV